MTQPPNPTPNQPLDPQQYAAQQQAAMQQYAAQQQAAAQQYQAPQQGPGEYYQEAPQPKRGFSIKQIISGVVTIALVGVGGFALWRNFASDQALKVGKCIVITGSHDDAEHKETDCSDASQFSWEVAHVGKDSSECKDETVPYEITSNSRRGGATRTDKVACLAYNLRQDVCYTFDDTGVEPFKVAGCSEETWKVTKRVDEANATCAEGEEQITYSTPARTYCLG